MIDNNINGAAMLAALVFRDISASTDLSHFAIEMVSALYDFQALMA